jgi:hypothetical protein
MESGKKTFKTVGQILTQFLIIIVLIVLIVASIGAFVYGLYRITLVSKLLYTYIILTVIAGAIIYFVVRGISKKLFSNVLLKFVRFFYVLALLFLFIALIMIYGAFVFRNIKIGIIFTPFLIIFIVYAGTKWGVFSWFKKIYRKLSPDTSVSR